MFFITPLRCYTSPMNKKLNHSIGQALKLIISVLIITWLVTSGKLNFTAIKALFLSNWIYFAPLLILANLFLLSERWRFLILTQEIFATRWQIFRLSMIGNFFNLAMPGGVGGDIIKAFYFSKHFPARKTVAATGVLIDRVLGLYAMMGMALLAMIFDLRHIETVSNLYRLFQLLLVLFLATSFVLIFIFTKNQQVKTWIVKLIQLLPFQSQLLGIYESFNKYGAKMKDIVKVIFISFIAQLFTILFLYFTAKQITTAEINLIMFFYIAPIGFMATAIPISPAGIGIGQAAFFYLYNVYSNSNSDVGATIITAFQVIQFGLSLLGSYFYFSEKKQPIN